MSPDPRWLALALTAGAAVGAAGTASGQVRFAAPAPVENVERFGLVNAPGVQETIQVCGNCHTVGAVAQKQSDTFWDAAWDRMMGFGMGNQTPEMRAVILTYLKTNHSSER